LLSNLLTNPQIREHIRYLSWAEPMGSILQNGATGSVSQVVRCIVNISHDDHCRHICVKQGLGAKIKAAASRVRDDDISDLAKTACSNLDIGVAGNIVSEVDEALRTGRVTKVVAPTSTLKHTAKNDFEGLDDLLGAHKSNAKPTPTTQSKPVSKPALDDLDSLLNETVTVSYKPPVRNNNPAPVQPKVEPKKNNFDELDDLLGNTNSKPVTQSKQTSNFDDLDDLLGPSKPVAKPTPKNAQFDDLDDLLSEMGNKPVAKPQPTPTNTNSKASMTDLDDLLGNLTAKPTPKPTPKRDDMDDIDSLLAEMSPPSKATNTKRNDDDIDSLLADLGSNKTATRQSHQRSTNEIDDLLADLL